MSSKKGSFKRLLEHGDNAALILDAQGVVTYCTPATERWLGVPTHLIGSRPFYLIHPEDAPRALEAFTELCVTADATRSLSLRVRGARSEWRSLQVTATNAMDDEAIAGLMIYAQDVTDAELLKDSLYHAQRMELTGRLAAGIAHDFNNALTIILSHADLIAAHAHEPGPIDVSDIRDAARQAAALTRQLLSLGSRQRRHATDVSVNCALEGVHRLLSPVLGERISFAHRPSARPVTVFIDPVRLDQALVNLVLNARDAVGDRGFIRMSADYLAQPPAAEGGIPSTWVRILITDNGCGMNTVVAKRAFEPHFTTKDLTGHGLGLAIVRDTVLDAGGTINVASTPEVGTTIEILLPAVELPGPTAAEGETDEPSRSSLGGGSETIVLVEDDSAVRQSIARTLHDSGYTVLEVPTVIDGVWLSDELLSRASLIVVDEILPDSCGHELVATFRHRRAGVPVLYMSGYPLAENVARRLDERTAFLPKPFDRPTLLRHIRRLLDTPSAK